MSHPWIADRMQYFDSSGIRKVFDLAAKMSDPINLSIGQPDFAVAPQVKEAAIAAIRAAVAAVAVTRSGYAAKIFSAALAGVTCGRSGPP